MSRKKGKAQQRLRDRQLRGDGTAEDAAAAEGRAERTVGRHRVNDAQKARFAPKATKIPAQRLAEMELNLDALAHAEGMVMGLYPGGALVRTASGPMLCRLAGTFRPPPGSSALAVGDQVTIAMTRPEHADAHEEDKLRADGLIVSRAKRRTLLARPQPTSGKHQDRYDENTDFLKVIAANMDQLVVVASVAQPRLRPALVERFNIIAERGGLRSVLVINKIDLGEPDEKLMEELRLIGAKPLLVSAATGQGLDELKKLLAGQRTILAGASGVGKSSLVNTLIPDAQAATREIRMKDMRGRHTTAAAVVYDLPDWSAGSESCNAASTAGLLVDTPGVRELAVQMDITERPWYFPEFESFARQCRFNDCSHTHEPDCAVRTAVEKGDIPPQRYESYLRMAEALEE